MYWIASKWEAEVKFWPLGNYFSVLSVLPCCIQHDRHGVQVYLGIMGPSAWANLHGKLLWLALNKLFGLCFIWPLLVFKVWTDPFRIEIVSLGGTCMHVCVWVCVCVCVRERERLMNYRRRARKTWHRTLWQVPLLSIFNQIH